MRILQVIPSYLPAKFASGPIIPTHNFNKELAKKGIEVVVYTTNLDGKEILKVPLGRELDIDGVKVYYFPITFRPWQYSLKLHQALAKNAKNFDLIHITSIFLSASALGAYYAKKFHKPYVISSHGSLMREPLSRGALKKKIYINLVEKKNLAGAAGIHFVVEKEKEEYVAAGLPLNKAFIIPNGINFDKLKNWPPIGYFRSKFKISKDKKIILFLARLHPIKGLDDLIPAFADAVKKEPKTILVLAGPDECGYERKIKSQISNLKINDKVIFTGAIYGDNKISALQDSDIFILPSYTEVMSVATLEAMCFGLPVIITKNFAAASTIEKAGAGIVVNKNVEELSEAILKILKNPELGRKMGQEGKKLVENKFSPQKIAEKWINEYNKLVNSNQ